jgi:hypothetical protein
MGADLLAQSDHVSRFTLISVAEKVPSSIPFIKSNSNHSFTRQPFPHYVHVSNQFLISVIIFNHF